VKAAVARVTKIRANAAADWHDATPAEMVVPTTIADEHATNPFLRAGSVEELGRRRAAKDKF
jgi:hydroxyacylglutathione hydrolase